MLRPIMINAAMEDVEMDVLKKSLTDIKMVQDKVCTFYEGMFEGYPIVLCLTGMGMVNAAISTLTGINKYNPCAIIIEGTAGAHKKEIHRNDIVVSTDVININSIKTSARKEGEGVQLDDWTHINFIHGEDKLVKLKADENLIKLAKKVAGNNDNIVFGTVGSGDIWNREVDRILMIAEKLGTFCEEMEGFAVFQVVEKYNIPAINIRVISNNELLGEGYDRTTGANSQEFTLKLIREFIKQIRN